ncbi:apolipoprotein N-acyltransferase [Agromyces kandeliae]|uniref:Apolipoprotein N-acyltransferase n=1 Tax=Agromyces kandeliae TaxID=2666141 RepID=A0A6L5R4E8_9MICO|nr:apolipoprotein N-acyltransferase [Agromyces kandeliae]MRX44839.1 apolipoprotein N-acyltransferase [Agromyces kandeliae]
MSADPAATAAHERSAEGRATVASGGVRGTDAAAHADPGTRPILPLWAALIVSALGGFVYDLGFPGASVWPLAFVGISMALVPLIGRSLLSSFHVGLAFGLAFYLSHVSWTSLYLGPIPWLALSILESLFVAGGAVLITLAYRWVPLAGRSRWLRLIALPALVAGLWVLRETVTGTFPYGGFPWGRAALSQSESPFAPVVSWIGSSGLGFVMVALTAGVIEWVRARGWRDLRSAVPVVVLVAIAVAVPAFPTIPVGDLRVASVQGNGPAGYFDEREQGDILRSQLEATEPVLGDDVDVLLWPEGGSDIDPTRSPSVARIFDRLSEDLDAPVVLNTVTVDGEEGDERFYNTSLLWEAGEGAVDRFAKRNPVPFGEYIPDRWFYDALVPELTGLIQRGYSPGAEPPVFDLGDAVTGLAICFDVIYDDLMWEGARDGAELYMLQTNNADFRGTDENQQQLAIARLRAIETGRSVVNISTVGTSQVIDPAGRTIDALPAYEAGAMVTDVELRTGLTPSVVLGGIVPLVLALGSLAGLAWAGIAVQRNARRRTRSDAGRAGALDS